MAPKKKTNKHHPDGDVQTGGGKGRDQYGRKFGKKHASAMMEFTKTLWMQDATTSLRNLLKNEVAQVKFREFLATEYGEAQLEFLLEAMKLEKLPPDQQQQEAVRVYKGFVQAQGSGIGQQERTKGTQQLWDYANSSQGDSVEPGMAIQKVQEEAETTLGMLAFDAFPRFLKSKYCNAVLEDVKKSSNPNEVAAFEGAINTGSKQPSDADEWLNMFVSTAESFPACIVISDMTIPGAPMVFINDEFTRTTGYTKEEAVGRNCRFLQGPDTEPESIAVIRNTLAKGQDCHVKLTNYRKNGEKFQNLLSMKPVFDADDIYRYVIGVQFEILQDQGLKKRLVQLDKLLRLLPSRLNLKSKAKARMRGKMASKTTGEANTAINDKEAIVSKEAQEGDVSAAGPRAMLEDEVNLDCANLNFDNTIFAFTKIMWLNNAMPTLAALVADNHTRKILTEFSKTCSVVLEGHFEFYVQSEIIRNTPPGERNRVSKRMHRVMDHNQLFYCTNNEVVVGQMGKTDMAPLHAEIEAKAQQSLYYLSTEMFPRFLNSRFGHLCIKQLRAREMAGEQVVVNTVAAGKNVQSSQFWLEMFKTMSETASVGMVVADMNVPGCPLAYINEGFKQVTGYGKENIGRNSKFLQGPETEGYMVEEIMHALQQHEPLMCKLHNHKADGRKFQCLLCLHPVNGTEGEYLYQIGMEVELQSSPTIMNQIIEMERILRLLPSTITGDDPEDSQRLLPVDYTGDANLLPRVMDMSAIPSTGPVGMPAMPGMPPGMPSAGGGKDQEVGDQIKSDITVGGKKNKTHYGKKFGKKHKSAMLDFTKSLWMQDAGSSLRNLLKSEVAQRQMLAFLGTEYGDAQLEFFLEAQKMIQLEGKAQQDMAVKIYSQFCSAQGSGIGAQERTKGTQDLWDSCNQQAGEQLSGSDAVATVTDEADKTLNMLAFDAFPRFLKSKYCNAVMEELQKKSNPGEVAALEGAINTAGNSMPQDADDWLNMFISSAESFPACIVISDMTIPGAPMVYINGEFTKTTGYTKEEAVGRNCRFLQGPDTEPESIAVIRNTLAKGQDCHVKLTNYRKNGEKFQNLLSMKPVFDGDNIYRYVIGVQFEILQDKGLKKRLVQLDKLLRLLPSRLNLKSKASAQARGALAAKTTGEANTMIGAKEQILNAGEQREEQEAAAGGSRPKGKFKKKKKAANAVNYDGTVFAFTKIMWLQDPLNALRCMLMDQAGFMAFDAFLKAFGSQMSQTHLRFWVEAQQILMTQGPQQMQAARELHKRMWKNALFYCTTNEIVIGNLNRTSWPPIIQEMARQEMSLYFLSSDCFTRFMASNQGREFVYSLKQREMNGEQLPVRTVSCGLDPDDPNYWMDMVKVMSETLRIGMVVVDMFVPGCPIAYLNEGFMTQTGYGKENIGRNSKFLQGPMTEGYMVEEIMEALRHADPLFCKLQNHKPDGSVFQCLLGLSPVFNIDGEYKYQIGLQVDFDMNNPETPMHILEMERVTRNLPQTITGELPKAMSTRTQELETFLSTLNGLPNAASGGLQPSPPAGNAPSWAAGQQPRPGAQWS
ncbi:unnamed protein product [Choristocarpus tenellus]